MGVAWGLVLAAALALLEASDTSAQSVEEPRTAALSPSSTSSDLEAEKVRRFWAKDKHFYRSRWYAAKHRKMIPFGCTEAPYYSPSPRCTDEQGFHHGLDIAMACGTRLFSGLRGTIVQPQSSGSLGSAYGPYAFRIRSHRLALDFVIGHVRRVYVEPGDDVARGDLIARASDQGAPDGCHLHFEARPRGESYDAAINPTDYLHLRRVVSPPG
jgi:murein DD-endopeptidase MepM/ murein hydrolase activator NlpD